jgi:hypothetical protein
MLTNLAKNRVFIHRSPDKKRRGQETERTQKEKRFLPLNFFFIFS